MVFVVFCWKQKRIICCIPIKFSSGSLSVGLVILLDKIEILQIFCVLFKGFGDSEIAHFTIFP
jgi:hypothetical protein